MSFVEDIRVNLSVRLASGTVKKIRAICGLGLEKPLANYDPNTRSWKMYEATLVSEDCPSLENLPPSGMTRNGVLYLQRPWEPITNGIESLSWPTPRNCSAMAATITPESAWNPKRFPNLETVVGQRMWPTPTAVTRPMEGNVRLYRAKVDAGEMTEQEAEAILGKSVWEAQGKLPAMWPTPISSSGMAEDIKTVKDRLDNGQKYKSRLVEAVAIYPTPTHGKMAGGTGAFNKVQALYSDGKISDEERKSMQAGNGGKLNPTWVEWLMGFPLGWTDLED
jgi:hypothetical protein